MSPQTAGTYIRTSVVVDAPIERAFRVFTRISGASSRPSTTCSRSRSPKQYSSRGLAGISTTTALTAASAASRGCSPTNHRVESSSAGTSARTGSSKWVRPRQAKSRCGSRRRANRTRVDLQHRNLERHGEGWEGLTDGLGGDAGWPLYLKRFAALLAEEA